MIISNNLDYEIEVEQKGYDVEVFFNKKLWATLSGVNLNTLDHTKLRYWIIGTFDQESFKLKSFEPTFVLGLEDFELELK